MNNLSDLKKAQNGDKEAYNRFYLDNIKLVYSLLKRFDIKKDEYEDVLQEACFGLCLAMNKFDFSYGVNFSTYAVPLILGEIRKYYRYGNKIKISRGLKELYKEVQIYLEKNENAKIDEIASYFNESKEKIIEALTLQNYVSSLDEEISTDNDNSLIENCTYDELDLISKTSLHLGIEKLNSRERLLIELRYYSGLSQIEVSKRLNISQVQVSREENRIISKLKEYV